MDLNLKFDKPYTFEHKEYEGIDLSGLDQMTIRNAIDIQKKMQTEGETAAMILPETATAFARAVATEATHYPIEFFKLAPRRVSRQIRDAVREYIGANRESPDSAVMQFTEPYTFGGETYTEIDLSGIDDLTSMHESQAENRMISEGFVVTETSLNYLYICLLASMATKKPLEFFTGLPMREMMTLKTTVINSGFFE